MSFVHLKQKCQSACRSRLDRRSKPLQVEVKKSCQELHPFQSACNCNEKPLPEGNKETDFFNPQEGMPRSCTPGHPDYLINELFLEPSLTFKDSMRTALGRERKGYLPLVLFDSVMFWTKAELQILMALVSTNPELVTSIQICPYAENEALTQYVAAEIQFLAEEKLAERFSKQFENHCFYQRNPGFPWTDPVKEMDPEQDLEDVFLVANREDVNLVTGAGAGPIRVNASTSAQPPYAYGPKSPVAPPQPRQRPSTSTRTSTSHSAVLYHAEPREFVELEDDEPVNPVAHEQSSEPPTGENIGVPPGFARTDIDAHYQHLLATTNTPPPGLESIGRGTPYRSTSDLLRNPYPGGDIFLGVIRGLHLSNTDAFLNHGGMSDADTGTDQFDNAWTNAANSNENVDPSEETSPVDLHEATTVPIPYSRVSSYAPENYFERALIQTQLARTWEFTAEDTTMLERLRSGNPRDEAYPLPDANSSYPLYGHIPQELWLTGPSREVPNFPPSVAGLWNPPEESVPSQNSDELPEPEIIRCEAWGSGGGHTEILTTSSFSLVSDSPESPATMDSYAGPAYVYPPSISPTVESPPIIEINQGRYRSYRELAKMNRILHDLPEEDKRIYLCVFCKGNEEPPSVYQSHPIRINGIVSCPFLRLHVCQLCKATGDDAHTIKYCPKNKRGFFATKARAKEQESGVTPPETSADDLANISGESSQGSFESEGRTEIRSPNPGTSVAGNQNSGRKTGNRKVKGRVAAAPLHRPRRRTRRLARTLRSAQG